MLSRDFVVGLGANLGNRQENLKLAVAHLAPFGEVLRLSSLFETAAVGPPQPDFLNAALKLRSELPPVQLLHALLNVERALGRIRNERWGPRLIDLDLLWSTSLVVSEPALTLPHPALAERTFALQPLLEVAPEATDPVNGRAYWDILADLAAEPLSPLAGTEFGAWIR